jgi:hypothetical protein
LNLPYVPIKTLWYKVALRQKTKQSLVYGILSTANMVEHLNIILDNIYPTGFY